MSQELPVNTPLTHVEIENLHAQVIDQVPGEDRPVAVTPEQVRTADEFFAREKESKQVIGLMGLWTGALLLHDVAVETFDTSGEQDEEKPRKKKDNQEQ
jgi:hypothetical protein